MAKAREQSLKLAIKSTFKNCNTRSNNSYTNENSSSHFSHGKFYAQKSNNGTYLNAIEYAFT